MEEEDILRSGDRMGIFVILMIPLAVLVKLVKGQR
jgi:hypothetical protein